MRFVRIYVNWDNVATMQQSKMTSNGLSLSASECGMVQPMRARIAGRVTPTTNQSEVVSLEMIEIPVNDSPTSIACCQVGLSKFFIGLVIIVFIFRSQAIFLYNAVVYYLYMHFKSNHMTFQN